MVLCISHPTSLCSDSWSRGNSKNNFLKCLAIYYKRESKNLKSFRNSWTAELIQNPPLSDKSNNSSIHLIKTKGSHRSENSLEMVKKNKIKLIHLWAALRVTAECPLGGKTSNNQLKPVKESTDKMSLLGFFPPAGWASTWASAHTARRPQRIWWHSPDKSWGFRARLPGLRSTSAASHCKSSDWR